MSNNNNKTVKDFKDLREEVFSNEIDCIRNMPEDPDRMNVLGFLPYPGYKAKYDKFFSLLGKWKDFESKHKDVREKILKDLGEEINDDNALPQKFNLVYEKVEKLKDVFDFITEHGKGKKARHGGYHPSTLKNVKLKEINDKIKEIDDCKKCLV